MPVERIPPTVIQCRSGCGGDAVALFLGCRSKPGINSRNLDLANAGIMSVARAIKPRSTFSSTVARSRSSCSSAVGPTSTFPKMVRLKTTPFVRSDGTGRMIVPRSFAAALSKTTN